MALGVLQGLTEFLPVSSSAHLILFPRFFGWIDPGLSFDVALHLGTLVAVVAYFREDLVGFAVGRDQTLAVKILLATIPGAIAGLLLEHKAEAAFRSPALIACTLIALGLFLWLADHFGKDTKELNDVTYGMAVLLGLAQSLALIPGVSRSGITITVALALGLKRTAAARFSFLMSIPIIAGAGILKAKAIWLTPDKASLAMGFIASAGAGFLAIWVLMRFIQRHRYTPFVIYRWALGIFVLFNLNRF